MPHPLQTQMKLHTTGEGPGRRTLSTQLSPVSLLVKVFPIEKATVSFLLSHMPCPILPFLWFKLNFYQKGSASNQNMTFPAPHPTAKL